MKTIHTIVSGDNRQTSELKYSYVHLIFANLTEEIESMGLVVKNKRLEI